jgi:dTDP-4-dehydrorhamnose 3,5-epimerase
MKVSKTRIPGILIIEPEIYFDQRGYFFESYNLEKLSPYGINMRFIQDNQSKSGFGVIRGLHYQLHPFAQTKLVRVIEGKIWDIAVDIRQGSPSFGKWFGLELSSENNQQLLITEGFAHGFSVLSEYAVVFYKCTSVYKPEAERGIRYDDPELAIDWQLKPEDTRVSAKDAALPLFRDAEMKF